MFFSAHFYADQELSGRVNRIQNGLIQKKPQKEVYVLFVKNGHLQAISSLVLLQKSYPDDFTAVGLACNKRSALRLIETITSEMYEELKQIDYNQFFEIV